MKKQLALIFVLIMTGFHPLMMVSQAYGQVPLPALGAAPGERLKFNVHWMGLPAGLAFMDVKTTSPGLYSLVAGVESIGAVKLLYPIKDRMQAEGLMVANDYSVRYFSKQQQRGSASRLIEYRFDREWGEAIRTQEGEETLAVGGVTPRVNDILTGFFTLRACPSLVPGAHLYLPMVDGQKVYQVSATVGNKEKLHTPLGWFDVFPMTVVVENSDLFRLQGSIVVWLTHDLRRMPVRVESRIDFKRVAADLISYDDGRGDRRDLKDQQ
ncbi:MAG: DUF3108 domain-containing protein [Magnetococcus sp. YQC-5]